MQCFSRVSSSDGCSRHDAETALRQSGNRSVAAAADWHFAHGASSAEANRAANDVDWLFS